MTPWLEVLGIAAALGLIAWFWVEEWREAREERDLQELREAVQERQTREQADLQRREQWETYIRLTCSSLAQERRHPRQTEIWIDAEGRERPRWRRHTRWTP